MDHFVFNHGQLFAEDVPVAHIAADVGTPAYVYSKATLVIHYRRIAEAFAALKPHHLLLHQVLRQPADPSRPSWPKAPAWM